MAKASKTTKGVRYNYDNNFGEFYILNSKNKLTLNDSYGPIKSYTQIND